MLGGGPHSNITGAPYSAVEVVQSQEVLSDGNRIVNKRQTNVFRDTVGRVRTEETITPSAASGKAPHTLVSILDPVAGYRHVLDSSTMVAHRSPAPRMHSGALSATAHTRPAPAARTNGPQAVTTNLGTQMVNGVLATGTQTAETIPAGAIGNAQAIQIVRTVWISNDLKVPVQIKTSDPRFGSTQMDLTNIAQSEPNSTLFVVPAGYTVEAEGGRGNRGGPNSGFRSGPGTRGPQQSQ